MLLGDSIFDNGSYVGGGPDVVTQLRSVLPPGWQATLLAVDGDVTSGVAHQLRGLPRDATHLVVSVGGNDALGSAYLLGAAVGSVAEAIALLSHAQDGFAEDYATMLDGVLATGLPTAVCTVYDTHPGEANFRVVRTALALFNDHITRAAFLRGVPLIDLRLVCTDRADYANPIEPSTTGGEKIARAIAALLDPDDGPRSRVVV